jgi:hypothetical protein
MAWTVVRLADAAAYQISPSAPVASETLAARTQWLPTVSATETTGARAFALRSLINATRRSPAVVALLGEAVSVALPLTLVAPNDWTTPTGAAEVATGPAGAMPVPHAVPVPRRSDHKTKRARHCRRRPGGGESANFASVPSTDPQCPHRFTRVPAPSHQWRLGELRRAALRQGRGLANHRTFTRIKIPPPLVHAGPAASDPGQGVGA